VMAASQGGKIKTATQIVAISVYLLPPAWTHSFSWIELGAAGLMVLAVAATVATGIDYVVQAVPVIRGMRQKPPVADAAPQLPAAPQVGVPPVNPVTAGPESAPAAGATEPGIEPPAAASVVPPGIKPPAAASPAAAQVAGRPALASSGLGASSGPRSRPVIPFRKVGAAGAQIEPDGGRVAPSLTGAASPTVPASPVPPAARPGAIPASPARPGAQLPAPPPAAEAVKPTRPVDGWPDPQVRRPAARPRPEPTPARRAPQWTELRTVMRAAEATPDSSAGQTSPTQLPSGGSPPAPTHPAPGLTPRPAGAPASPTPDATQLGDGTGTSASGSETAGQDAALAAAQAKLAELKRRLGWDAGPAGN
jgi:hypothetical protein